MRRGKSNMFYWIVLGLLGLFLIVGHNAALNLVCKIVAVGLIVASAAGVYNWLKTKSKAPDAIAGLIGSVAFCAIGLWVFLKTDAFIKLINVVLGVVIIVSSAYAVYRGWKQGKEKLYLILPALGIVLGLIIACTRTVTNTLVICMGLGLVYTAVTGYLGDKARK